MKKVVVIGKSVGLASLAWSCASFSEDNSNIGFTGQTNIVIWDSKTHTEHFIRQARFASNGKEFDFVAPTPTVPEIANANFSALMLLRSLTGYVPTSQDRRSGGGFGGGGAGGGVVVMSDVEVGDLKATTLKASDGQALKNWMDRNGYRTSKSQSAWFQKYIDKGWFLTAFRMKSKKPTLRSQFVRMTSKTDEAYNPYYVPRENWSTNSSLELYFLAPLMLKGYVGETQPWQAKPEKRTWLSEERIDELAKNLELKRTDLPEKCLLVKYFDNRFAQGATDDLFFR